MVSIFPELWRRVKHDPRQLLDPQLVDDACVAVRATTPPTPPSQRPSKFSTYLALVASILQAIHGHTALTELGALTTTGACAGTFCRLRQRLPLQLFEQVAVEMAQRALNATEQVGRWRGLRVFVLDGTGFSMPDLPALADAFGEVKAGGRPSNKPLFPFAHALGMLDLATGMIVKVCLAPGATADLHGTTGMHRLLMGKGDLLLADRGFSAVSHLAVALWHGLDVVVRAKHKDHRGGEARGQGVGKIPRTRGDVVVRVLTDRRITKRLPTRLPLTVDPELFACLDPELVLREVVYEVGCSGYRSVRICLWSSLLDSEAYPAEALAGLYLRRWQIEVGFRDLKQTVGAAVMRGRSPEVVLKEFWSHVLAYNLVRMVIAEAANGRAVEGCRISFVSALRFLRRLTTPVQDVEQGLGALVVNPVNRRHREPRVVKRNPHRHDKMSKPRHEYFLSPAETADLQEAA